MSTTQQQPTAESTPDEQQHRVPHPRYTPSRPLDPDSTGELVDAWIRGAYPIYPDDVDREDGVIDLTGTYCAFQHDDGSGYYGSRRGSVLYAVRTPGGTIIGNESRGNMWPYDSELADEVGDGEYIELPFPFVGGVATEQTDHHNLDEDSILNRGLDDGETHVEGPEFMRHVVEADILTGHEDDGVLLTHETGIQVYIGWDSTAHDGEELFGFVPFDGENGTPVPSAEDALDLLKPDAVVQRDDDDVKRQGEWFLVPVDDDEYPTSGTIKPGVASRPYGGSPLESHVPRDYALGVTAGTFLDRVHDEFDSLPDDIRTVQGFFDSLELLDSEADVYETVRDLADGIYVRGTVRHRENDHRVENVGEQWHKALTHDEEVLTSVERRIAVVD